MTEEEKKEQKPENEDQPKAAPKSKGMLLFVIIGCVAFVAAIGIFSMTLGVFSSAPSAEAESNAENGDTNIVEVDSTLEGEKEELSDIEAWEAELLSLSSIGEDPDLDDIMTMAEKRKLGLTGDDSLLARHWLDAEKQKLAIERKELDAIARDVEQKKVELDSQEYRLKQLIAKAGQVESARINALARLYDGMKPAQVAPLITKLTEQQAVDILLKMKPSNAAKILGALNPNRAASISSRMITFSEE